MKATLVSTTAIVSLEKGVRARVWEGTTESGVPFIAYIALCQVRNVEDTAEFERDLQEMHKSPEDSTVQAITLRHIR